MILGVVSARSVQHHALAAHFTKDAQTSSHIRRIERFYKDQDFSFDCMAKILLSLFLLPHRLDLVIDRTNWQFGKSPVNYLVLSVLVDGKHGIPLFWSVLPKKGSSSSLEQIDLLQKFVDVFDADRIHSLMADREFIGQKWLNFLATRNIPFYVRMKKNRHVEWGEENKPLEFFFHHLKIGERRLVYKELQGMKVVIAGTRSKAGEMVLVMTNNIHQKESKILQTYSRRWHIECLFKNAKSNGFNLESTHVKCPNKLAKLMGVIAMATALCVKIGQWQEKMKPTRYKRTVRSPLHSTFRRGFDAFRRWLTDLTNILRLLHPQNLLKNKEFLKSVG
jgi:hypothetical protein